MTESEQLRHYNAWRRGWLRGNIELELSPKEIDILLDSVADQMAALEALRANPFQHVPLPPTKCAKDLAAKLKWLSEHLLDIATDMEYYGGFDAGMVIYSKFLVEASSLTVLSAEIIYDEVGTSKTAGGDAE